MKKQIFLLWLFVSLSVCLSAQNRHINFEQTKQWNALVKKAKKAKKLIFVDCYTSWCGPCKMLAKNVFTQDSVADYFNKTFINAQFDMEKDKDGVMLKNKFAVKAFPTLVFVDPATQEVVHRMVGAGTSAWLLKGANAATNPQENLAGLTKRYNAGERTPELLEKYLTALSSAYMADKQEEVANAYLNSLSTEQLATKNNWMLIVKNINDPLSAPLKKVMENKGKFYAIAGKEIVDYKLNDCIYRAAMELALWKPESGKPFNEQRNTELINYLLSVDSEACPAALAYLYSAAYVRKKDFNGLLDKMKDILSYNLFREHRDRRYFQDFIETLTECDDNAIIDKGIQWLDQLCANTSDYFEKADLMDSKARLQTKKGDTAGAEKSKMEEDKYAKEGERMSGGRMMRAIRMN